MKQRIGRLFLGIICSVFLTFPVLAEGELSADTTENSVNISEEEQLEKKIAEITEELNSIQKAGDEMEMLIYENTEETGTSSGNSLTGSMVSVDDQVPSNSMQLLFAKLQLEMSNKTKTQSEKYMNEIAALQQQQKLTAAFIQEARTLKLQNTKLMPDTMKVFMQQQKLHFPKNGMGLTEDDWDNVIISLENYQVYLGQKVQQQMVFVQDYIAQYNSYIQETRTQISNADQLLQSLSRGQTMFGGEFSGIPFVCVFVGVILGVVLTLIVQNLKKGNKK